MKTPYLDENIEHLKKGAFHPRKVLELKEFQLIKEALEPKLTIKEYMFLLGEFYNNDINEEKLAEKLGIKFKEPEIELIDGEYYYILYNRRWSYKKYNELDESFKGSDGYRLLLKSCKDIKTKNNPPTWD
ncbi:MAG: hypothetical protein ACPGSO_00740 [Vicingaceae bacterium]